MSFITINAREISVEQQNTVLEAALENGIYIPHLCFFPNLGASRLFQPKEMVYQGSEEIRNDQDASNEGCNLCLIKVEGKGGLCHACTTPIEEGMIVQTETQEIQEKRRQHLEDLFMSHPHVCLTCGLAEGCNRKICSMDIPEEARCCWKFGNCELAKVASCVGCEEGLPYASQGGPTVDDNPLFTRNHDLCVNCLRCVVACRKVAERDAIGFVGHRGRPFVGTTGPTMEESGCKFCLACVDVCPTGALREKEPKKSKSKIRLRIASPVLPPEKEERLPLRQDSLNHVPEGEGVYRLFDESKALIQITGTENLREALAEELENMGEATFFDYEEDEMFTMRERQLIQQYMKKHGKMPPGNDEMDELF